MNVGVTSSAVFPGTKIKSADVIASCIKPTVGCYVKNGVVIPALSVVNKHAYALTNVDSVRYSDAVDRYFISSGTKAYSSADGYTLYTLSELGENPFLFEERGDKGAAAYFAGAKKYVMYYGTSFTVRAHEFGVNCGVIKNGRLFGLDSTDGLKLRWSGEGGAFDVTEGISGAGWAYLPPEYGRVLHLLTYSDRLIAVREYGVTVVEAYGNPENFKIHCTDTRTPKIYKNTVALNDGRLLFFTDCGLYAFDGSKVGKIAYGLEGEITKPTYGAALGGKYFVCGKSASLGHSAVLIIDIDGGSAYLADVPAVALCCHDKVIAYANGYAGVLGTGGRFTFTSGEIDFGTDYRKYLTDFEIDCDGTADVTVISGKKQRAFTGVRGRVRVGMSGRSFVFKITAGAEVKAVTAHAEVISGV